MRSAINIVKVYDICSRVFIECSKTCTAINVVELHELTPLIRPPRYYRYTLSHKSWQKWY